MNANPQTLLAGHKAAIDNLIAVQGTFFNGFEKLIDLNMRATRAVLDDVAQKSQEAVELKDAQEVLAFTSSLVRPDQAVAYSKHVYDILSDVHGDLNRLAEAQFSEGQRQVSDAIDQLSRNAPTGSEGAVALLKSSLATATNAYETVSKAARQAADAAESNISAATNATLKAANDVAATATKAAPRARRATAN